MRRLTWCSIALAVAVVGAAMAEVTPEDLAKQTAKVAAAQSALDSLTSLSHAQSLSALVDSNEALAAAGVRLLIATRAAGAFQRDPEYVDVSVPYDDWDAVTRRWWSLTLRETDVDYLPVRAGRYSVHRGNVERFLALVVTLLDSIEEEG